MVATPLPDLVARKSTNVRTFNLPPGQKRRPKTVPETLDDLLDWLIGFSGLGLTFGDVDFQITRADLEGDLGTGRDD
jgi:hypothetical protein